MVDLPSPSNKAANRAFGCKSLLIINIWMSGGPCGMFILRGLTFFHLDVASFFFIEGAKSYQLPIYICSSINYVQNP